MSIELIGRDAADARLLAKVWRWVWFKDSGPTIALTRTQQLEHRAYLLLLAERVGVQVSSVVIAGIAGARETALLVLREPDGLPLPDVDPERVTDSVLDDAWQNLARLHEAGLAHGMTQAANVVLLADGTTAFVDFARRFVGSTCGAPPRGCGRAAGDHRGARR